MTLPLCVPPALNCYLVLPIVRLGSCAARTGNREMTDTLKSTYSRRICAAKLRDDMVLESHT